MAKRRDIVSLENPEAVDVAPRVENDQMADLDQALGSQYSTNNKFHPTH